MRKNRTAQTGKILCLIGLSLCAVLFFSCSRTGGDAAFNNALSKIDVLIASGHDERALRKIASLRTKADSASQWLSLVKRERNLGRFDRAALTLRKALERIPASDALAAVMVDTLVSTGNLADTATYVSALGKSPYAPVAALAELKRSVPDPLSLNPVYSAIAWDATGNPAYRRNAAVLYAMLGNYAEACAESPLMAQGASATDIAHNDRTLPGEAYFRALLSYDAGFCERVLYYLPPGDASQYPARDISLVADAAWRLGDTELSRRFWQASCALHRGESPLPLYNLAVIAKDKGDERVFLETCTVLFPDWYPAVVRMVRNVSLPGKVAPADEAEETLRRGGFRTLAMEEADRLAPTLASDAQSTLDAAIEASRKSESGMDVRFPLEQIRFDQQRNPDSVRSSSLMWKLLEQYPGNRILEGYALWYFASIDNFDACFSLNGSLGKESVHFYAGIAAASSGDADRALAEFAACADDELQAWAALANTACIHAAMGDDPSAADEYSRAAILAPDDRNRSHLQYEASRILLKLHSEDRARTLLAYAIELDPSNYLAYALLRELEAAR